MEHKHLFDESELASLRKAEFDQRAARTYDMLSGGFRWSDERLDLAALFNHGAGLLHLSTTCRLI